MSSKQQALLLAAGASALMSISQLPPPPPEPRQARKGREIWSLKWTIREAGVKGEIYAEADGFLIEAYDDGELVVSRSDQEIVHQSTKRGGRRGAMVRGETWVARERNRRSRV